MFIRDRGKQIVELCAGGVVNYGSLSQMVCVFLQGGKEMENRESAMREEEAML